MVEARGLRVALNGHLHALPALRVFAPAKATVERRDDGATVRIAGGPIIDCRLVVAAEGRNSPLRRAASIPVTALPYDQTGIVCAISHANARTTTRRWNTSCRPARSPNCRCAPARRRGRWHSERFRHRLDRAHADSATLADVGRCQVRP